MSNNKNIPYEVLRQIFKHAVKNLNNAQHWLAQYQLVCKSWTQTARYCLYISVKFDDYLVLMDFIHSIQNCLGHLTRTIILGDDDKPMDQIAAPFISELAKACPNVDRIKGRHTGVLAWHAFKRVASTSWIGLKELPTPALGYSDYIYGCKLHHEIAIDNRSTLTCIDLPPEPLSSQLLTRTIDQLPFFSNLTHLTIEHIIIQVFWITTRLSNLAQF